MPRYAVDEDGQIIEVPDYEPKPVRGKNDMSDLFEVPKSTDNDMRIDHLFELPADDDLSDLVEIKQSDLTGYSDKKVELPNVETQNGEIESQEQEDNEPHWSDADIARTAQERSLPEAQRRRPPVFKRTTKRYPPTPPQIGEMRL